MMLKTVTVQEVEGEGLSALLGKKVMLFCMNYIYTGTLAGVNDRCVLLDEKDAGIVYETGAFNEAGFADYQAVGHPLYVQVSSIEAFSETDKS